MKYNGEIYCWNQTLTWPSVKPILNKIHTRAWMHFAIEKLFILRYTWRVSKSTVDFFRWFLHLFSEHAAIFHLGGRSVHISGGLCLEGYFCSVYLNNRWVKVCFMGTYIKLYQTPCFWCIRKSILTHWSRDKMAAVSQTTLSNAFSWMTMLEFRLRFQWSLFLRVQLTIIQDWFR